MLIASLTSLTACTTRVVGDFCDVYTVVDMTRIEAERLNEPYRSRILSNELYEYKMCK